MPSAKRVIGLLYHIGAIVYVAVFGLNIAAINILNSCHLAPVPGATGAALTDPRFEVYTCASRLGPVLGTALHAFVYGYVGSYKTYSFYYIAVALLFIVLVSWFRMSRAARKVRSVDTYLFLTALLLLALVGFSAFNR